MTDRMKLSPDKAGPLLSKKQIKYLLFKPQSRFALRMKRPFQFLVQRCLKNMPLDEQRQKEGRQILQLILNDDFVIVLDDKGKEYTTVEFASRMEKIFQMSKKRAVFVIGGPWGFSADVYARADLKMSLSRLTFSHQMVRLLFAEQLYRVFTVIKGDPYHHD